MRRRMMKSKIHRATVTDANLHYVGSITVDRDLMDLADLLEYEQVAVVDIDNGARLETYVIEGERGSGEICLNGAAARLVSPGDKVIIISYADYEPSELDGYEPTVVHVDSRNRPDRRASPPSSSPPSSRAPRPTATSKSSSRPGAAARRHGARSRCADLDLLVLGSGVAGLSAAVRAAEIHGMRVGVLTKAELQQATTRWAQGGVAAVLGGDPDSTDLHLADTLAAGAGLCDVDAVRVLVDEGPARVHELIALGATFDRDPARATSSWPARAVTRCRASCTPAARPPARRSSGPSSTPCGPRCRWCSRARSPSTCSSRAAAAAAWSPPTRRGAAPRCEPPTCSSPPAATGSCSRSPPTREEATGDGVAMAIRAGVAVADVEFEQFHPTALHHPVMPRPLLTEALRGHGALLRDAQGRAVRRRAALARQGQPGHHRAHARAGRRAPLARRHRPRALRRAVPDDRRRARQGRPRPGDGLAARSPRPPTTAAAGSSPTSTARRRSPACGWRARRAATA